jgi:hypothetical protein
MRVPHWKRGFFIAPLASCFRGSRKKCFAARDLRPLPVRAARPPFGPRAPARRGETASGPPHPSGVHATPSGCASGGETAPYPREAPRPQRGAPDKSSGPCARGAVEGPSPPRGWLHNDGAGRRGGGVTQGGGEPAAPRLLENLAPPPAGAPNCGGSPAPGEGIGEGVAKGIDELRAPSAEEAQ